MLYLTYYNLLIMIRGKLIYKLFTSFSNCIYNSNLYNLCENVVVGNKSSSSSSTLNSRPLYVDLTSNTICFAFIYSFLFILVWLCYTHTLSLLSLL